MYTKKTEYTLEQLIVIFIEERKKLQYLFLEQMGRMGISRECIDYMFEKWIEVHDPNHPFLDKIGAEPTSIKIHKDFLAKVGTDEK